MNAHDELDQLLSRWQEAAGRGEDRPAADFCRDRPELLPELERRIHALRQMERLARLARPSEVQTPDANSPPTASFPPPGPRGTAPTPARPAALAGYEIVGELGRGGMGVVYRAYDARLKRTVAIKQLLVGGHSSEEQRARFRAEAEAVARLQHPHIVQVFHSGEQDGQPYFVLEFVPGGSLDQKLPRGQPQPVTDSARLVMLLTRAVHAAHQAGVVHRDLKPANVLLAPPADEPALNTAWGCPKVADFGLARLRDGEVGSASGQTMGTPDYMAPEQAEGRSREIGPASDVWSLCVILYELLTGRRPFHGSSLVATVMQVCHDEPEPVRRLRPEVPEALAAVVSRCLAKRPAERYPSATALADDLRRWLGGETAIPIPPVRAQRRPVLLLAVAGVLGLALLTASGWWLSGLLNGGTSQPSAATGPVVAEPFKGWIDILVSEKGDDRRQLLRLHEPRARPLRPGDEVRVEVVLKNRPGYAYVLWIDALGKVIPIYPWEDMDWKSRPRQEKPMQGRLLLPENGVYPIDPSPEGLETLVMLVRQTPLPADVDVPGLLGDLGPQTGTDRQYVRWFENGDVVTDEADRAPGGRAESSDPAERTQHRIRQRLGDRFAFSRAVSFFNLGKR